MECAEGNRRLDELSRDDLLKKCHHLLAIAQKAKQSRTALLEENGALKQRLAGGAEVIDRLTEQKLSLTTQVDEMTSQRLALEERLFDADNLRGSYERQIGRLSEENEQLLFSLDSLEKQTAELQKLAEHQRRQLLELESNANGPTEELQRMLSVSLEEIQRLKAENESTEQTNERLKGKLKMYHSKISRLAGTAKALREDKDHLLSITKSHMDQVSEWRDKLVSTEGEIVRCVNTTRTENERLKSELQRLRSAASSYEREAKALRIVIGRYEPSDSSRRLTEANVLELTNEVRSYKGLCDKSVEEITNLAVENKSLAARNELLEDELRSTPPAHVEGYAAAGPSGNAELLDEMHEMNEALKVRGGNVSRLERALAERDEEARALRAELAERGRESVEAIEDLRQELASMEEEKRKLVEEVEGLRVKLASKEEDSVKLQGSVEAIEDLRQKLGAKEEEERKLIEELSTLRQKLASKEGEERKLIEEVEGLRVKVASNKEDSIKLQESVEVIEVLRQKLSAKEEEECKLIEELGTLRQKLASKEGEERKLIEEVEGLRVKLSSKEEESIKLQESLEVIEVLRQKLNAREDEECKLFEELDTLKRNDASAKLQESMEAFEDLRQKLASKEEEQRKLIEEVEDLRVRLASKEEDSVKLQESVELIEDLRQKLSAMESEERNLTVELDTLRRNDASTQLQESIETIEALRQKLASKEEEQLKLIEEVEDLRVRLASKEEDSIKLQESVEVIQDLRQKLSTKEDEERKLIEELDTFRRNDASAKLQESMETIEALRQKLASVEEEERKLLEETEDLRVELASKEKDSIKLQESMETIEELRQKLTSKDKQIEELTDELNGANGDSMSTSTISRSDESSRLKELEGSWEERYGKLRALAVKLKGKVRELTSENEGLQRTAHGLREEREQYLGRLDVSVKVKDQLVEKDDIINSLRKELDASSKERAATEEWKKQISAKVQTLRKELQANAVLRKDSEARMAKLGDELRAKEQALEAEAEAHRQTRASLEQLAAECKRHSVLSLEMQDYERSSRETSRRLQHQQEQIDELGRQLDAQRLAAEALRGRNAHLDERLAAEASAQLALRAELDSCKATVSRLEAELRERDSRAGAQTRLLEAERLERERLALELSKVIAEHERAVVEAKAERDRLRGQAAQLQQALRDAQDALALRSDELRAVAGEYEAYRVRAQSVLRQNQGRDVGLEERMSEEIASLNAVNAQLDGRVKEACETISSLEARVEALTSERESYSRRARELAEEVADLKAQYGHLAANHERTVAENSETIRSLKVHAETLSQCYRQQLSEQESRHSRELAELRGRLERLPAQAAETPQASPTMPREEGEGSESVDSVGAPSTRPVPLERLLGSDEPDAVDAGRLARRLADEEAKVTHLTALLSDTEKDLVKHVQMNELLKEEIRRQQRSVEREEHAENLEYLKNVIFKFVTLSGGDERSRLVPVLNTILKLSPEETRQLTTVARGDGPLKAWTSYLPTWPSK